MLGVIDILIIVIIYKLIMLYCFENIHLSDLNIFFRIGVFSLIKKYAIMNN